MEKKLRLSNSAIDLYERCPKAYFFQYVQGLKADITSTPLLYGIAMDSALNYILESMRDKKDWNTDSAKDIFIKSMESWNHQNRLDFFKSEVPEDLKDIVNEHNPDHQEAVWDLIVQRGLTSIDVYIKEVVSQIDEVLQVQTKGVIENAEGHQFVYVLDFIAKMKDGRVVLMDNKTSSARYPKNKVQKSQQLSLYLEQFPDIAYAGYAVLIKNPEKERGVTYQLLIDTIPEETIAASYKKLDETLNKIANKEFPCNMKSCMAFGKPCVYKNYCMYGDSTGLIDKKVDKK